MLDYKPVQNVYCYNGVLWNEGDDLLPVLPTLVGI